MNYVLAKNFHLVLLILIAFQPLTQAQESNVSHGINDYYYDADFQDWVSTFESPGREVFDYRKRIVDSLNIQPGTSIADIGAGTGLFTMPFAYKVGPKGRVYAVDISKSFIDNIVQRAKQKGFNNVAGILNDQYTTKLPKNSIDMTFISNTYHHFEFPKSMLSSIHDALKDDGLLVIIDFQKIRGVSSNWVMGHVRLDKLQTIHEVEQSGYKLIGEYDFLKENYFLVFNKIKR